MRGQADLPKGWLQVTVGEACDLLNGRAFKPTEWGRTGRPIIRIQNLNNPGAPFNHFAGTVRPEHEVDPEDLLFAWSGTPGTSFGAHIWAGPSAVLNQHIFKVIIRGGCFDKQFLRLALNQRLQEFVAQAQGGVGLAHITKGKLESTVLPLPPLQEQRRIVAKLDELLARGSAARTALDAVPGLLDQYRQALLATAFNGDLTATWRASHQHVLAGDHLLERIDAEISSTTGRRRAGPRDEFQATELPPLPSTWRWVPVRRCARRLTVGHVGPMQARYVADGVPFLRSQNVRENRIDDKGLQFIPPDFHADLAKSALSPGDVVVVRSGAPGVAAVIPAAMPDANCADLVITRFSDFLDPELMARFINSRQCRERVFDRQVGVAQQHFNVGAMRQLPVPIMPCEEQHELVRVLRQQDAAIARIQDLVLCAHQELRAFAASALRKAFQGELVPQDPNDEPASALIANLRSRQAAAPATRSRRRGAAPT